MILREKIETDPSTPRHTVGARGAAVFTLP